MVISIDTGNKQIKTKNFTFQSGMTTRTSEPDRLAAENYFKMDGKFYCLTNQHGTPKDDKTTDERYFDLTIMGIVKELDKKITEGALSYDKNAETPVTLLVGLPPAHMDNAKMRSDFRKYFKTPEAKKVVYKGRTYNILIKKVCVYSQCYAGAWTIYEEIAGERDVLIFDIGGFTSDYITVEDGVFSVNSTDSINRGVINFYQEAISNCRRKIQKTATERQIDDILGGRILERDKPLVPVIRETAESFVEDLLDIFTQNGIDLSATHVVFMGGGSILLKEFIEKSPLLVDYSFIDNVNANVEGYELLYKAQLAAKRG